MGRPFSVSLEARIKRMKNWIICLLIGIVGVMNAQTSATYTAGVIGTEYDANPGSTALVSSCADTRGGQHSTWRLCHRARSELRHHLHFWRDVEPYSYLECVSTVKEPPWPMGRATTLDFFLRSQRPWSGQWSFGQWRIQVCTPWVPLLGQHGSV